MSKDKVRRYTKVTRKRLSEVLALVGWRLAHVGCNFYVFVNPYGKRSDIMTSGVENEDDIVYEIKIADNPGEHNLFGKTDKNYVKAGFCSFILKGCFLEAHFEDEKPSFVSIITKPVEGCKQPSFICFKPKFD